MTFARPTLPVATLIAGFASVCALVLALPRTTVTAIYVNDLLIFLDGAHRIASGQVPNRDFHTALGRSSPTSPGRANGSPARSAGRFRAAWRSPSSRWRLQLPTFSPQAAARHRAGVRGLPDPRSGAPVNLGESIASLSFAMFYNRIGWAALAALLVMYLRPLPGRAPHPALDAVCAAALTVAMLFTKATYGAVALGFLGFMLSDRRQRAWAGAAIMLTVMAGLIVEAFWRSSLAHVADLMLASRVSGARPLADLVEVLLRHLPDFAFFAMLTGPRALAHPQPARRGLLRLLRGRGCAHREPELAALGYHLAARRSGRGRGTPHALAGMRAERFCAAACGRCAAPVPRHHPADPRPLPRGARPATRRLPSRARARASG
jgi:hypothetical protein